MEYKFGKRSLDNLKGIHPNLVKVLNETIKRSPVDFTITEGVRTTEEQQKLYSYGRTKINPDTKKMTKVTNADGIKTKSNHQVKSDGYGHAVDLYPFFLGKVQVHHKDTIKRLEDISKVFLEVGKELGIPVVWGGHWKNPYDPPHFQLKF